MPQTLRTSFTLAGLVVGVPVVTAHGLNWNPQRKVKPDLIALTESGYTVTADTTNITVTRLAGAPASVTVYATSWHSITRAFGPVSQTSLTPQPIVIQGSTGGGGGGGTPHQVFRYTRQVGDTDTITIALPAARASANYNVQVTPGVNSTGIGIVGCDPASFTVNQFVLKLTSAPSAGDSFMFFVEDLT